MQGLGLQTIPDVTKMNISQNEYITKYNEYLYRVRERKKRELLKNNNLEYLEEILNPKKLISIKHNINETNKYLRLKKRSITNKDIVYFRFPINLDEGLPTEIEEATLKLLIGSKHNSINTDHHSNQNDNQNNNLKHSINLKVYQLIEPYDRIWLDSQKIYLENTRKYKKWLKFDVTKAVYGWFNNEKSNLGIEIHCENCHHYGISIIDDINIDTDNYSGPILNVIGRLGIHREKRSKQYHHLMHTIRRKPRKTDCFKENQKCCRHTMDVSFQEIKGFEFIIQPKTFDAGYCRGKCPPRYNPAHHHALLQSLIWKQDKDKAPRPCCAPSKLVELEVLHVDEKDNRKLKVSTWTDMRVVECACS